MAATNKVKEGLEKQLRSLVMKEKRQAESLKDTQEQIAALREILKTV